jgi:hypothetical protein
MVGIPTASTFFSNGLEPVRCQILSDPFVPDQTMWTTKSFQTPRSRASVIG